MQAAGVESDPFAPIDDWEDDDDFETRQQNSILSNRQSLPQATNTTKVRVGNIPAGLEESGLRNLCLYVGKVKTAFIRSSVSAHDSNLYGFVEFDNCQNADNAVKTLDGLKIGRNGPLTVSKWVDNNEKQNERNTVTDSPSSNTFSDKQIYLANIPEEYDEARDHEGEGVNDHAETSVFNKDQFKSSLMRQKYLLYCTLYLYRFVIMESAAEAKTAIRELNRMVLPFNGPPLIVRHYEYRTTPRSSPKKQFDFSSSDEREFQESRRYDRSRTYRRSSELQSPKPNKWAAFSDQPLMPKEYKE